MKLILNVLSILILLSCTLSNEEKEELKELTKEDVEKAFCKIKGISMKDLGDGLCVEIPQQFKHIASIGLFANDRGCMGEGVYFNGKFSSLKEATPEALNYYGWGDQSKRDELALNWTLRLVHAWESPVNSIPSKGFSEEEYFAPKITINEEQIIIELWVQKPAGMRNESNYYISKITFNEAGEILSFEKSNSKTVPGD